MLVYTLMTLKTFQFEMMNYMLNMDRASMSDADRRASIANQRRWTQAMVAKQLPPLLKGALPFYSPVAMPKPKSYDQYIAWFENNTVAASHMHFIREA